MGLLYKIRASWKKLSGLAKKLSQSNLIMLRPIIQYGRYSTRSGQVGRSYRVLQKAISIKPDYAEAYLNIGTFFQDQGKLEEAIESYKKAISIKPDYAEAYLNIGTIFQDQGKLDEEAIEAYNKALSLKPDYTEAYNNIGAHKS